MERTRVRMRAQLGPQHFAAAWPCRTIRPDDGEKLGALMLAAYENTIDYEGETLEEAIVEARKAVDDVNFLPDCSWLIEGDAGFLSACVVWWYEPWQAPLIAFIMTHPTAKGKGMGRFLMQKSMQALHDRGETEVYLAVTEGNDPAQHLYVSLGFVVVDW